MRETERLDAGKATLSLWMPAVDARASRSLWMQETGQSVVLRASLSLCVPESEQSVALKAFLSLCVQENG
jgi:hypothetical protein